MFLLSVDLGTTGCKCLIFSLSGSVAAESYIEYPLIHTAEGYIEQDANLWWELVQRVIVDAVSKSGVDKLDIRFMSISSQGISFVPVDKNGKTLCNALSWLDIRAGEQVGLIRELFTAPESANTSRKDDNSGDFYIFSTTGKRIHPAYSLPKLMRLKQYRPEIYAQTWKFLMGLDYITYRLTGKAVTDHSMASGTMAYNINTKRWDGDILGQCGIDTDKLPDIEYLGTEIGNILPEVAERVGLSPETTIVLGAQDQKCAAVGSGIADGVCTLSLGTSSAISVICNRPTLDHDMSIPCFTLDEHNWILETSLATTGASLKWMRDTLFPDKSYREIDAIVEGAAPGSNSVFFYPHLEGASAPYWDPDSRGFICGLSLTAAQGDILRSLYEGIAYQIRANLEIMGQLSQSVKEIRVFGGGSKGAVWLQIISDVTGLPVKTLFTGEAANLGAAEIAGRHLKEAADSPLMKGTDRISRVFYPDNRLLTIYTGYYERYLAMQRKVLGYK